MVGVFTIQLPRFFIVRKRTVLGHCIRCSPNKYLELKIKKPPLIQYFGIQCLVMAISVVSFYLISGENSALSAFIGSVVFIIPQQYFAFKSFRYMGARAAAKTVQSFYSAESSKLLLIAMGFALVFSFYKEVDVFALMTTFIVLVLTNGIYPLLTAK